jgi:hypothetical protein
MVRAGAGIIRPIGLLTGYHEVQGQSPPQHHHVKNGAFLHFLKIQEYFLQINFNGAF